MLYILILAHYIACLFTAITVINTDVPVKSKKLLNKSLLGHIFIGFLISIGLMNIEKDFILQL